MGKNISVENPRESVVRQLKYYRKDQGMTQEELAERVGTKKSNISRLESGRYNPSLDFLVKVADGLGKQITMKVK
jgi:transcriptional regulator with XRE-family HTH domain